MVKDLTKDVVIEDLIHQYGMYIRDAIIARETGQEKLAMHFEDELPKIKHELEGVIRSRVHDNTEIVHTKENE